MKIFREKKDVLDNKDILKYIETYEENFVPAMTEKYRYYIGDNPAIMDRKKKDPNNPDNRTPAPYGKKIVTTFTGYGYRPRYITYKIDKKPQYMAQLQRTFDINKEHIKTAQHGRNTAIFGLSYELMYIRGIERQTMELQRTAEPAFVVVDPRELILLYDDKIEPSPKIAIRFAMQTEDKYIVDVYYKDYVKQYIREREVKSGQWVLTEENEYTNYYKEVPVNTYYLDDVREGIIKPVIPLINDMDTLLSGNIDEVERFANAYLRLVGMSLSDPTQKKSPNSFMAALQRIKRARTFENLKAKDDVTFLTKDLPAEWMKLVYDIIKEQIHIQSHVPDFSTFKEMSGIAVQRLMFDFENVVSTAEAEFDVGLQRRIDMINVIYKLQNKEIVESSEITISHKRNAPLNIKEFAETANIMKQAGFSAWLCADVMPDDIIPDVEAELQRQDEERNAMFPDVMEAEGTNEEVI